MARSLTVGAKDIRESIGNFPLPASKRAFLEAFVANGGEATAAAKLVFPDHSNPTVKGNRLLKQLAPYVRLATVEYTDRLRPVALGVVVRLMKGEVPDTPPAVRLKAAEVVLERADRMVPEAEGGTRGKETLEGFIRVVLNAVGAELAKQLLAAKGIPAGKVDEVLAQLTGPKIIEAEDAGISDPSGGKPVAQEPTAL